MLTSVYQQRKCYKFHNLFPQRHHYWHQKHTLDEARRVQVRQGVGAENRLRAENRALSEENRSLKEDSNRLTVELYRLQEENSRLNRVSRISLLSTCIQLASAVYMHAHPFCV